jgi:predicted house-cleaning noncanonical NTP pyrophosphatase (MazG superfamily)
VELKEWVRLDQRGCAAKVRHFESTPDFFASILVARMSANRELVSAVSWEKVTDPSAEQLGGKAAGLLALPQDWTPPFVVLGPSFLRAWTAAGNSAAAVLSEAGRGDREAIQSLFARAMELERAQGLIVRSNAPSEGSTSARGRYLSHNASIQDSEFAAALDKVLAQSNEDEPVYAVVQVRLSKRAAGHLSNERRVAERSSQWLIEEDPESGRPPRRIRVRDSEPLSFEVGDRASLYARLRQLACELRTAKEGRTHCEWVWDGLRLWVVQRDRILPLRGGPVAKYLGSSPDDSDSRIVHSEELQHIVRLTREEASSWSKLKRRYVMESLGLPVAPVYFLSGPTFVSGSANGFAELRADIANLTEKEVPLVVRCDLTQDSGDASLSLPTSPPLLSTDQLLDSMQGTADWFSAQGVEPSRWAFLPASLVPARASVMVQARPGAQVVRHDALWGFPDGVSTLPHDSYFHYLAEDRIEVQREYKGTCLLWTEEAGWTFQAVPAPFDWAPVLNEEEIRLASSWAMAVAKHLSHEVQLMVLAGVGGRRGGDGLVPWHYTDHAVPARRSTVPFAPRNQAPVVREAKDLDLIDGASQQGVLLRPAVRELRDQGFILAVGRRAVAVDAPIFFEGSILGHAFYLLRSTGAHVISVGVQAPDTEPTEYNKLVRDRIPEIVSEGGGRAHVVRASGAQAGWLLKQKLVEEAIEIWRSNDDELVEELADLSEVLHALYYHLGVDSSAVEASRKKKLEQRGGFRQLLFLESTVPDATIEERHSGTVSPLFGSEETTEQAEPAGGPEPVDAASSDSEVLFRIPMAPPLWQGLPLQEQRFVIGGVEVLFEFQGAYVAVRIARASDEVDDQLSLEI